MTILPKKKPSKETNETDSVDHSQSHLPHGHSHGHNSSSEVRVSRRTVSPPPRWNSPTPREEKLLGSHDPTSRYEDYGSHESSLGGHNKRRHRSSPHRTTGRKHGHRHESKRTMASSVSTHSHSHRHGNHRSGQASTSSTTEPVAEELDGYNSGDEYVPPKYPDNVEELERWFVDALKKKGNFSIKKMAEDGACLFRAVADQVFGDQEMHMVVRQNCLDYMAKNSDFFKPYVTEDFNTYLNRKRMVHSHGNHIEMQALSELYNRPIEVYQYSTEPINTFHGSYQTDNEPIRLSYHRNAHYNSVLNPGKATIGVGLGLPGYQPGLADKNQMTDALQQSEDSHIEKTMLEDKLRETDWEVTQETIEEQVARESYLQWLRDQEKRARSHSSPRSASATCSSASACQSSWWDSPADSGGGGSGSGGSPVHPAAGGSSSPPQHSPTLEPPPPPQPHSPPAAQPADSPQTGVDAASTDGAVGGALCNFDETDSFSAQMFGLSEWDEDTIIAQVIAQSQHEYLASLKKNATPPHSTT